MLTHPPIFIGSPSNTSTIGRYYDRYQDLDDDEMELEDNNPPPSNRGNTPLREPETNQGDRFVRRPPGPPFQQDNVVFLEAQRIIVALVLPDPFATVPLKKRKTYTEVFSTFTGWPKGNDPMHVKLGEAGLAMAKRVFHPPEATRWPTAEANAFMKKFLTLIPSQKVELESDLYQEDFLKEHEKNPSYKQAFDFKTKMFGSLKSQRTSLVLLFKLLDKVVQVKQTVDDTLDMSGAVVTPEDHLVGVRRMSQQLLDNCCPPLICHWNRKKLMN